MAAKKSPMKITLVLAREFFCHLPFIQNIFFFHLPKFIAGIKGKTVSRQHNYQIVKIDKIVLIGWLIGDWLSGFHEN